MKQKGEPDRINYSFGMKVNLGNYESADFHISLSSDLKEGETEDEAYERVRKFVQDKAEEEFDNLRRSK